jgi:hypothetical protein
MRNTGNGVVSLSAPPTCVCLETVFSGSDSPVSLPILGWPVRIAYRGKEDGTSICREPWRARVAWLLQSGKRESTDQNGGATPLA